MEFVEETVSGVPLLRVVGDVDHYRAPAFKAAVFEALAQDDCHLLLDLTSCAYIDSGGIAVILSALTGVRRRGWMGLIGCSPDLARIFGISGLTSLPEFRLFASREAASEALAAGR